MAKNIISVCAFGLNDMFCINNQVYCNQNNVPSVVIEDRANKLYLYGESAIKAQTGTGINSQDDFNCRIPVSALWQQLKQETSKQRAADTIFKFVLSAIMEKLQQYSKDHELNLQINRAYVREQCQIVLCIPDHLEEDEQQCLLKAFSGFSINLLWRSVAALIGLQVAKESFTHEVFMQNNRTLQLATSQGADAAVSYIGPDSIDYSLYEFEPDGTDSYIVPVRKQPIYDNCSTGLGLIQLAAALASEKAEQLLSLNGAVLDPKKESALYALFSQLLYKLPESWLNPAAQEVTPLNLTIKGHSVWAEVSHLFSSDPLDTIVYDDDLKNFYHTLSLTTDTIKSGPFRKLLQARLFNIMNKWHQKPEQSSRPTALTLLAGPAAQNPRIAQEVEDLSWLSPEIIKDQLCIVRGGVLFQQRFNKGLKTYLDRLRRFAMVSIMDNEYTAKVLIDDRDRVSPSSKEGYVTEVKMQIKKGANSIELYVSSDPKFTDDSVQQATQTGFGAQGIRVKKAILPFRSGNKALQDEVVSVIVQQRPLSGYIKVTIKPTGPSSILPAAGEVTEFAPSLGQIYEGTLTALALMYPPLPQPVINHFMTEADIRSRIIAKNNVLFSSSNKSSQLLYYAGHFVSPSCKALLARHIQGTVQTIQNVRSMLKKPVSYYSEDLRPLRMVLPLMISEELNCPGFQELYLDLPTLMENKLNLQTLIYDPALYKALFSKYCEMSPDNGNSVRMISSCISLLRQKAKITSTQTNDLKKFIENRPATFSPKSRSFAMTREFAEQLYRISLDTLQDASDTFDGLKMLRNNTITGRVKLSSGLLLLMYSLLIRKTEPDFPGDITEITRLLNTIFDKYLNVELLPYFHSTDPSFQIRYHTFVYDKLGRQIPEIQKFLEKHGTNLNIMNEINELSEGATSDE